MHEHVSTLSNPNFGKNIYLLLRLLLGDHTGYAEFSTFYLCEESYIMNTQLSWP